MNPETSAKSKAKRVALVATLFAATALALCSLLVQPLLPSSAYVVTATFNGHPIQAELLHPPFMPGVYYVHLPEVRPQRYDWFGIAFSRKSVFWPGGHYKGCYGIRYIHTDQAQGIRLTDPKMEDHWSVGFASGGVQFSNASLAISLNRAP